MGRGGFRTIAQASQEEKRVQNHCLRDWSLSLAEESSESLLMIFCASHGDRRVQDHCLSDWRFIWERRVQNHCPRDGRFLMGRGEFGTIDLSWGEESSEPLPWIG
jgi:hypothetical protein